MIQAWTHFTRFSSHIFMWKNSEPNALNRSRLCSQNHFTIHFLHAMKTSGDENRPKQRAKHWQWEKLYPFSHPVGSPRTWPSVGTGLKNTRRRYWRHIPMHSRVVVHVALLHPECLRMKATPIDRRDARYASVRAWAPPLRGRLGWFLSGIESFRTAAAVRWWRDSYSTESKSCHWQNRARSRCSWAL